MGMMPGVVARWLRDQRQALQQQAARQRSRGSVLALSKFLRLAVQIAVLGTGALLVVQKELTAGP